jgi:hypothetical protein
MQNRKYRSPRTFTTKYEKQFKGLFFSATPSSAKLGLNSRSRATTLHQILWSVRTITAYMPPDCRRCMLGEVVWVKERTVVGGRLFRTMANLHGMGRGRLHLAGQRKKLSLVCSAVCCVEDRIAKFEKVDDILQRRVMHWLKQ